MSDAREQADQVADRLRDDLLSTLEELDRRRHRATDWRYQLSQHRRTVLIAAGGVATVAAAAVGIAVVKHRAGERLRGRRRWKGLRRAWEHPERLASRAADAPGWQQLLRKVVVAFGVALAVRAGKQLAGLLVPGEAKRPVGQPYLS